MPYYAKKFSSTHMQGLRNTTPARMRTIEHNDALG
jgi:hypothetical protein